MTSPATQELVKLEIVKQDMQFALHKVFKELEIKTSQTTWIGMESMKNSPHSSYLLRPKSIAMAFTELSAAMDDPFDSFHPPDTLPLDTYDPTKPCYLFTIPRELRDMIYDTAISSGNIKILQTSKRLHKEGIELLYKRRVCHLNIDLTKYIPKINLQKPIAALIQNVNIEIVLKRHMGTRDCRHNIKPIRKFSGSTIRRLTCRVVLLFTFCDCSDKYVQYFRLFMRYLETLIGFSRLLLEIRFRGPMNAREQRIWPHWRMAMLERAQDELKGVLGPSIWHGTIGPNCDYLEFHPGGHIEANPGTLSPKVQRSIDQWAKNPERAV